MQETTHCHSLKPLHLARSVKWIDPFDGAKPPPLKAGTESAAQGQP